MAEREGFGATAEEGQEADGFHGERAGGGEPSEGGPVGVPL